MDFKEITSDALIERRSAIVNELDAEGADLDALETEVREINAELETRKAQEAKKVEIRNAIANGEGEVIEERKNEVKKMTPIEERANSLAEHGKYSIPAEEVRSTLISSETIATPTGVSGINDIVGGRHGSILDYIKVVNCEGMGSNKIAYLAQEAAAAGAQTEGSEAGTKEATFSYVTITPSNIAMKAQISKQVKKQSPLQYEAKVSEQAMRSLRKALVSTIVTKMKASTLVSKVNATLSSGNGAIDEKTLRTLVLSYGGDDAVEGGAMLFLNKTDLIAFGDVRGTNEKGAVYEIIPDGGNPNTGVIREGGLSVRYCLVSDLTACSGTAQGAADKLTMFYGNPMNCELDLFSPAEVRVSEDFAFTSLMDTIVGDVEAGADIVAKNGFVVLTIAHS